MADDSFKIALNGGGHFFCNVAIFVSELQHFVNMPTGLFFRQQCRRPSGQ